MIARGIEPLDYASHREKFSFATLVTQKEGAISNETPVI